MRVSPVLAILVVGGVVALLGGACKWVAAEDLLEEKL